MVFDIWMRPKHPYWSLAGHDLGRLRTLRISPKVPEITIRDSGKYAIFYFNGVEIYRKEDAMETGENKLDSRIAGTEDLNKLVCLVLGGCSLYRILVVREVD